MYTMYMYKNFTLQKTFEIKQFNMMECNDVRNKKTGASGQIHQNHKTTRVWGK